MFFEKKKQNNIFQQKRWSLVFERAYNVYISSVIIIIKMYELQCALNNIDFDLHEESRCIRTNYVRGLIDNIRRIWYNSTVTTCRFSLAT